MLLSRPCTYAIRALVYLAMQPPGKVTGTKEISDQEDIPNSFLSKVLLQLRRKRLLRSFKGIGGGYELAMPPSQITLLMIVRSIDGDDLLQGCILEDHECHIPRPCALHDSWMSIREQVHQLLETSTVAELVRARMEAGTAGTENPIASFDRQMDQ